jgi:hypothetical protein
MLLGNLKMQGAHKYSTDFTAMEILSAYTKFPSKLCKQIPPAWVEPDRTKAFKQELDGVLVYDSHARINDEEATKAEGTVEKPAVDLDSLPAYDRYQFQNLPPLCPQRHYPQVYHLQTPRLRTLFFESRFESGNLRKAARVSEDEYNLWLETDYGTQAHTQWYYFKVKPFKAGQRVTFSILNFMKPYSLYTEGLKPLVHSKLAAERCSLGWSRGGDRVEYFENTVPKPGGGFYYTLRFSYCFRQVDDEVSFAHCFPYTYTDLQSFLSKYRESDCLRIDSLCDTLAGNQVPVLTITQDVASYPSWEEESIKLSKTAAGRRLMRIKAQRRELILQKVSQVKGKRFTAAHCEKQGIVLTARVHPGESNSSLVMEGFLEFLLSSSSTARFLRTRFVFKVVPMLNPDGVIYGNYRSSLLGVDLNRRWRYPSREVHPEIFYTKRLLQMLAEDRKVLLFCDLHGHSAKNDAFMYGCKTFGIGHSNSRSNALIRVFPALMAQHSPNFRFKSCLFRMERAKQSTARIVVFKEFSISNSFTLETSFKGSSDSHFTETDLRKLGLSLCRQILALSCPRFFRKKLEKVTLWVKEQNLKPAATHTQVSSLPPVAEEESDSEIEDPSLADDDWSKDLMQLIGDDFISLFSEDDEEAEAEDDSDDSNSCVSDVEEPCCVPGVSRSGDNLLLTEASLPKGRQKSNQRVKTRPIMKSQSIPEVTDDSVHIQQQRSRLYLRPETKADYKPMRRRLGTPLRYKKPDSEGEAKPLEKVYTLRTLAQTFDSRVKNSPSFRSDMVYTTQIKLNASFAEVKHPEAIVKTAQTAGAYNTSSKVLRPIGKGIRVTSINLPRSSKQPQTGMSTTFKHKRMAQFPSLQRSSGKGNIAINSFFLYIAVPSNWLEKPEALMR